MSRDRDTVTAVTSVQAGKGPARDSVLLGKYRVETMLGFGGMGIVIRAHNLALDERVAIKFLREDVDLDEEHVERFLREAKAAVRIKSEHIAKIRDVGTLEDGRPYMVMELLEGLDLGKLLVDEGFVEPPRAVDMILQACDAIAEAHSLGIVHRDIKPSNLFVTKRRDGTDLIKVLDFGISKALAGPEMSLTQTSSMLGTPAYMSPEQMRSARSVDPRSDIWAIGTVLYELVEGRAPFEATNFAELVVMVSTEPYAPMTRAPELAHVIERCLAKSLDERFQSVGELAAALEYFADDQGRAQRQVNRIMRVLGTPAARDSTPLPMSRSSMDQYSAFAPTPTVLTNPSSSGSVWKTLLVLVLLFGVGIAGGLYVTSNDEQTAAPPEANEAVPLNERGGSAAGGTAVDARDAGVAAPANVVDAGVGSGSATVQEKTLAKQPPKKQPPKKQPPKRQPPKKQPPKKEPEPPKEIVPVEPPKPKCDPFASPKGCR